MAKSLINVKAPVSIELNSVGAIMRSGTKSVNLKPATTVRVTCGDVAGLEFLNERTANETRVLAELKKVHKSQWNACVSGPNKSQFMTKLNSIKKIGQGSFGQVYLTQIANSPPFVIKEAYLNQFEQAQMLKHSGRKREKIPVSSYPEEAIMLSLVKNLVRLNKCPNYLYAYDLAFCESCQLSGGSRGFCYLTIMEPGDGDLTRYFETPMSNRVGWSVLYQLLMAVQTMHSSYGIYHRDIKAHNVLYKSVPAGGWYSYTVENMFGTNTYHVENAGVLVLLSDFGVSQSLMPNYCRYGDSCGHRNAKRVVTSKGKQRLEPIVAGYQIIDGEFVAAKPTITWNTGNQSTNNIIYSTFDPEELEPSTPIDLNDTVQFPAIEFFDDIMDVLHMFSGNRRMCLPSGNHHPFKGCPDVKAAIATMDQNNFYYDTRESLFYLYASEMLKALYQNTMPKDGVVLAEYRCK